MNSCPPDAPPRTPHDVAGWVAAFQGTEIPVLSDTAEAIEELRGNEEAVDARLIADTVASDPLMTLKVLAHAAGLQRNRESSAAETVTEALVLIGITPFFRAFGPQPTVEQRLAGQPEAFQGLRAVLRRSRRAARFALAFAAHRMDYDAAIIHEAAMLHDVAEMLLWLHAPALALEIEQRQRTDPALRSADVQRELLHVELADVQHALLQAWCLPGLLIDLSDDRHAEAGRARNVLLAIRVARHSARSWDNPALPDDVRDIAQLLNLGTEPTSKLLHEIDGR